MPLDPAFGYLIIVGIALLFASAAAQKLRSPAHFAEIFAGYRLLPDAPARRLAWLIPCIELAVAAALLWEPGRRMAVISAAAVLIAYASGLGVNLFRGRLDLDCGCGAAHDRRALSAWMVWRNLLLASLLGIAALPWSPRACGLTDLLTVMAGLMACAALYAAIDRLLGDVAPKAAMLRMPS
jgi:Methylamine utilisation protein MauE